MLAKKIYTPHFSYLHRLNIFLIVSLLYVCANAQSAEGASKTHIIYKVDTMPIPIKDSLPPETVIANSASDSSKSAIRLSPNAIESMVEYSASDSAINDLQHRYTYLFGDAVVRYQDMTLQAAYIEIDFAHNELYASGVADHWGNINGHPVFTQGETEYRAHEIKYNFSTRKGKITHVITMQEDGFVHGEQIKKINDSVAFLKSGKYTTCELENPHYEIRFTKAKLIQHDKVVTGPAYLSFEGVPAPLAIPFGFFPIEKGRKSGFVMPSIGESAGLGFYVQNLGFYFGISDNLDLLLAGDIYTRGSWAVKAVSDYVYRYKYKGQIQLAFSQTHAGEKLIDSTYRHSNDFKIYWDHKQDMKSNPTTRFNAHVDIVSSTYSKYNLSSVHDYLSNQYTSSINVSSSAKDIFYLDATLSYTQNTKTEKVNFKLPDVSMSVIQFYPFRKKDKAGTLKWFDNISMKWTSRFTGQIDTYDTLFFKPVTWQNFDLGMMHTIPLTIPVKIAKTINWNTSITLIEKWYLQSYTQNMSTDTANEMVTGTINKYFRRGFNALHDLNLSSALTTKIYLLYSFKKGGLKALRHVITPTLDFTYQPDLSGGTTDTYFNPITGENVQYSLFSDAIFGAVTGRTTAIARISFDNNIEIKIRSRRDTITGIKKIAIFDNVNVSMYYDFAADSLNWSPLTVTGRSTLFKQLYFTFNFAFDPYSINTNGVRIHQREWKVNHRLFRMSSANFSLALNWRMDQNTFNAKKKKTDENQNRWSATFNYTFTYGLTDNIYYYMLKDKSRYTKNMIHTLNVAGEIQVTKKWKLGFRTGYDFVGKDFSYTSLDIYRDLHCWEMSFNWIPFGYRKGWSFTINVKSSVLKDVLKYNLHHDFRDNL